MLPVQIRITLPDAYTNAFADLFAMRCEFDFEFEPGTHVIRTESVALGTLPGLQGRRLLARFCFEYTYSPDTGIITVPGVDFSSSGGIVMETSPEGIDDVCVEHAAAGGFRDDDWTGNALWNSRTRLTPGLSGIFNKVVRMVGDQLIQALCEVEGLTVQVRTHAPELSSEMQQQFLFLFEDEQLLGAYTQGTPLKSNQRVLSIDSVWGGEVYLNYGKYFANVIGSTHDPKISGLSWLQLWQGHFGRAQCCTSYQFNGVDCGSNLVGGHVIEGTTARWMQMGSNSVWILPICVQHSRDDNVYMSALKHQRAIWLNNYFGS